MSTAFRIRIKKKNKYLFLPDWENRFEVLSAFSLKPANLRSRRKRRKFAGKTGFTSANLSMPEQVHSTNVRVVRKPGKVYTETDGLVTAIQNIPLSVVVADCLAVYILDPLTPAIGLVHAGWRGTFGRIAVKALNLMRHEFGTSASGCFAAIGPGICAECYTVGNEIAARFRRKFGCSGKWLRRKPGGKYCLDLKELNLMQMAGAGVRKRNITVGSFCTSCRNDLFFSYRREGKKAGRNLALLEIK